MCGIAGIYQFDGDRVEASLLERMGDEIAHRGPDGTGICLDQEVGLVHRRLKIIDLTDKAAQPMTDTSGHLTISYNGEIYNYVELRKELEGEGYSFRSGSDTEVILAAYVKWKEGCVKRFNGMFAFALWDRRERRLFCAKRQFGQKPFYYHHSSLGLHLPPRSNLCSPSRSHQRSKSSVDKGLPHLRIGRSHAGDLFCRYQKTGTGNLAYR